MFHGKVLEYSLFRFYITSRIIESVAPTLSGCRRRSIFCTFDDIAFGVIRCDKASCTKVYVVKGTRVGPSTPDECHCYPPGVI